MKIAIVMPLGEQRGGAELMLLHLLRANRQRPQADFHLAFLEDGPMVSEVERLGYPVQVFPAGQLRDTVRYARTVVAIKRWLQEENIQIAMAWMAKAHLYSGPAAALAGVPAVWWQHGLPEDTWLERLTASIPVRMIYCCSQTAQAAQNAIKPQRKTCVVYPAVDLAHVNPDILPTPAHARKELGLPVEGPLVGIVCRLQHWKGVHVFLEAASEVARVHEDANFVVVGGRHALEPDYARFVEEQVESLGISRKVCFTGYQTNSALWMQALDVVVHASVKPEPFGMVVIEGMALGKTVIAAEAGGPLEIIEDGVDGLLTVPGDASALAAAIRQALEGSTAEREVMAAAARRKAQSFGTERLATDVAWNLQKIISKK